MAIVLGSLTLDPDHTTVREKYEEVGGRDARRIEISGMIVGLSSVAAIEAALDEALEAVSELGDATPLSLRTGRRLLVQRVKFVREIAEESLVGSFVLTVDAHEPFEESISERTEDWAIEASGATLAVAGGGNVFALPMIVLTASGAIVSPSFSDGTRTLAYAGVVEDGKTLALDGASGVATLDGVDVTPYTTGEFPRIDPLGTTLIYADDTSSSHTASAQVAVRDRWW